MSNIDSKISEIGIVPVIRIDDVEKAIPLAQALRDGDVPVAEVTFRTEQAEESIRRIAAEVPEVLIGAGTVITIEQADRAIAAGAKFIVSPGINPKIVEYCLEKSIPIFPGCITPTEIETALGYGLKTLKFFPAEQAGGLDFIKAVCAPYGNIKFMPTGGISLKNLGEYLSYSKIAACGGSYMSPANLINESKWEEITELCKKSVEIVRNSRK